MGDEGHEAVEVEGGGGPAPFRLDALQAAEKELAEAELLLDRGEGSFAGMTAERVGLLSFLGRHLLSVAFAMRFVLLAIRVARD